MASSSTVTRDRIEISKGRERKFIEKVTISWTAHTDGTFTATSIDLAGFVLKVVTNPGSTAPTANYDIAFNDPDDSSFDAMGGLLANRHTSNTEHVYPYVTAAITPVFLAGTYQLAITNNSVNGATGQIILYLADEI